MTKSKSTLIALAVALAAALPAPSAQGSELAKLGRLIVTGKRAPAAEPKPAPAAPQRESVLPSERNKFEGVSITTTQRALDAVADSADEAVTSDPTIGSRPTPEPARSDRVGRASQSAVIG